MAKPKYTDQFPELAKEYASEGLNDRQIAAKLGISISCYYQYQLDHSEFKDAIKKGKAPVDKDVENALLKKALGFTVILKKPFKLKTVKYLDGKRISEVEEIVEVEEEQYIVPDTVAQIFWLKNRISEDWSDKKEISLVDLPKIIQPIEISNEANDSIGEDSEA